MPGIMKLILHGFVNIIQYSEWTHLKDFRAKQLKQTKRSFLFVAF